MRNLDDALFDALSPKYEPDEILNAKIIGYEKEKKMGKITNFRRKSFPAAVAAAALIMVSSVTAFAAWRYLSAKAVAKENADSRLAQEFETENWIDEYETQSFGKYDITLLGVVAGNEISDHLSKDDQGNIDGDKTYAAVAISNSDGSPMPGTDSEDFDLTQFFVSPYIKGLNPIQYNAYTLHGSFSCFVSDGVQYRLLETNNIECFADRGIYIGVSESMAYDNQAYSYDESSGELNRNEAYQGVNALFVLDIDPAKGDQEKAAETIKSMDNYEQGGEQMIIYSESDIWANSITPENVEEKGVPVESSRKTMSIEEFYMQEYGPYTDEIPENVKDIVMEGYFWNGTGMSELINRHGTTWEDTWVDTYTLNEDDTVTYLRYVPK